jgi:hypothetical protein
MDTAGLYHRVMRDVLARSKKEFAAEHLSENILGKLATVCFNSIPSLTFDKEYNHLHF